jgi:meckelin
MDSSIEGTCSCEGKIVKQRDASGKQLASLTCEECPPGEFAGLRWECAKCNSFKEEYVNQGGIWVCHCKSEGDYKRAGESCITEVQHDELAKNVLGGDLKFSKSVTYPFLLDKEG